MIDRSVARRYGKALFDIAAEKGKSAAFKEDLALVANTIQENDAFRILLTGRVITTSEKKELVQQVFGNHVSIEILNFLCVALDKGREAYIADILDAYVELLDEAAGIVPVDVCAAISLDEKQQKGLSDAFTKKLGRPVRLEVSVDKALIGGLKVQIGDTVYDGSIANQLEAMHAQLCK